MADSPTGDANREVAIAYTVKGDAEQKAHGLAHAFEGVHRAAESAKERVHEVGREMMVGALGAAGLTLGLREIWEHSKDVNLEMEAMQKRIAGSTFAFATWKKGTTGLDKWRESMKDGVEITEKLESVSRRHKVSREELSSIYASQTQMSERYRQSQAQQIDMTEKLAATQNVLGISAESSGQIIARAALTGSIPVRTELGRALAGSIGNLKTFRHLSEEVRFEKLKKAMGDLVPASQEMGKGMKGALFDIHEAGTEILRDLTKPMFGEQTKALREWAANLTKIRQDGQSIAHEYGEKIAKAFTTIKDVSGAIAEHWKLIAGMLVVGKLGGMATSVLGAFGGGKSKEGAAAGIAGGMTIQAANVVVNSASMGGVGAESAAALSRSLKPSMGELIGKFTKAASSTFLLSEAIGGAAIAVAAFVDTVQTKELEARKIAPVQAMTGMQAAIGSVKAFQKNETQEALKHLKTVTEAFGLKPGQHIGAASISAGLERMDRAQAVAYTRQFGVKGDVTAAASPGFLKEAGLRIADEINKLMDEAFKAYGKPDEKSNKEKAARAAPITNIGVVNLTQDFKADDPERVFHRAARDMVSALNQLGNSPDHSVAARNN